MAINGELIIKILTGINTVTILTILICSMLINQEQSDFDYKDTENKTSPNNLNYTNETDDFPSFSSHNKKTKIDTFSLQHISLYF